jgi:hypothetical protein
MILQSFSAPSAFSARDFRQTKSAPICQAVNFAHFALPGKQAGE